MVEHAFLFYYVGLLVFALNGLIWLGQRNEVAKHRAAALAVERIVRRYLRRRGGH